MKTKSINEVYLQQLLSEVLPQELQAEGQLLSRVIAATMQNKTVHLTKSDKHKLTKAVEALVGSRMKVDGRLLSFGEHNNLGDVSFGDVAGNNIIRLNINMYLEYNKSSGKDSSHNKRIIEIHQKRLQILEEQAATFGVHCPPHIMLEIETEKEKIRKLNT